MSTTESHASASSASKLALQHFADELNHFEYQDTVIKHLLTGKRPSDIEVDASSNVSAVAISDWSRRYSSTRSPDLLVRAVKWYMKSALSLEDLCVLIERGDISFLAVLEKIWPNFYATQRAEGVRQHEVIDEWLIDSVFDVFSNIISRPASDTAAHRERLLDEFVKFDKYWGPLISIKAPPRPLPTHGLPNVMRDFIIEAGDRTEFGRDIFTAATIGALASALTGTVRLKISNTHKMPINPTILVLAESSAGKSPTKRLVMEELVKIELELKNRDKAHISERTVEISMLANEIKMLEKIRYAGVKAESGDKDAPKSRSTHSVADAAKLVTADDEELRKKKLRLEYLTNATVFQYSTLVADTTPEAFLHKLAESWTASVSMISDETTFFEQAAGLYGGKNKTQDYLIATSGDSLDSSRVGRKMLSTPFSCAELMLMMQPKVFDMFIRNNKTFLYNGMMQRLNVVFPESFLGSRKHTGEDVDPLILSSWYALTRRVKQSSIQYIENAVKTQAIEYAEEHGEDEPVKYDYVAPRFIELTEAGRTEWIAWKRRQESLMLPGEKWSAISGWYNKSLDRAPQFAALFTLADDPEATEVNIAYLGYATELVERLAEHSAYALEYSDGFRNGDLLNAIKKLHEQRGAQYGEKAVTTTDVNNKIRGLSWMKNTKPGYLQEMLETLSDMGYLKIEEDVTGGRGRRKKWVVLRPYELD